MTTRQCGSEGLSTPSHHGRQISLDGRLEEPAWKRAFPPRTSSKYASARRPGGQQTEVVFCTTTPTCTSRDLLPVGGAPIVQRHRQDFNLDIRSAQSHPRHAPRSPLRFQFMTNPGGRVATARHRTTAIRQHRLDGWGRQSQQVRWRLDRGIRNSFKTLRFTNSPRRNGAST